MKINKAVIAVSSLITLTACGFALYYPRMIIADGYEKLDEFQENVKEKQEDFFDRVSSDLRSFECISCEVSRCLDKFQGDLGFCAISEIATAHCIEHATNFCKQNNNEIRCLENN